MYNCKEPFTQTCLFVRDRWKPHFCPRFTGAVIPQTSRVTRSRWTTTPRHSRRKKTPSSETWRNFELHVV